MVSHGRKGDWNSRNGKVRKRKRVYNEGVSKGKDNKEKTCIEARNAFVAYGGCGPLAAMNK